MLRISRKMLAHYLGIHPNNVKRHYQFYLDVLEIKRNYLTIYDVSKVDNVPPLVVAELCGETNTNILKAIKNN